MTTAAIRGLFEPEAGTTYLDTATFGLPPRPTVAAMQRALAEWQAGTAIWREWERDGETCRGLFAQLIGARADDVALIPTTSVGVGIIASTLGATDEVVVPADEFTSVLYPFLVAALERGTAVREVPFDELAAAIGPGTTLVAFSLVQSQGGRTAPFAEICRAARARGARVLVDTTQATPFVPVAAHLNEIDYLVCHGYKHLLCPRGVTFLYVHPDRRHEIPPILANWRSADDPHSHYYGGPLALSPTASRFDVSLAWLSWVGARQSLELLVDWQRQGALAAVVGLAGRLARRLDMPAPTSSIVGVPIGAAEAARAALDAARVRVAVRAGLVRLSPHVYNDEADVDRAADVLAPLARPAG